jgi:hypothetical protein
VKRVASKSLLVVAVVLGALIFYVLVIGGPPLDEIAKRLVSAFRAFATGVTAKQWIELAVLVAAIFIAVRVFQYRP